MHTCIGVVCCMEGSYIIKVVASLSLLLTYHHNLVCVLFGFHIPTSSFNF